MDSLCTLDIILCWLHDINTYILHIILVYTAVFQIRIFVYIHRSVDSSNWAEVRQFHALCQRT